MITVPVDSVLPLFVVVAVKAENAPKPTTLPSAPSTRSETRTFRFLFNSILSPRMPVAVLRVIDCRGRRLDRFRYENGLKTLRSRYHGISASKLIWQRASPVRRRRRYFFGRAK